MLYKSFFAVAALMLATVSAMPAEEIMDGQLTPRELALEAEIIARAALTATNPVAACNCPNNCGHSGGSGCAYKAGSSCDGTTVHGVCKLRGSTLTCVPK